MAGDCRAQLKRGGFPGSTLKGCADGTFGTELSQERGRPCRNVGFLLPPTQRRHLSSIPLSVRTEFAISFLQEKKESVAGMFMSS